VGRLERVLRWCRREPAVAALLGALALTVVLGSSTSVGLWLRAEANYHREQAEHREAEKHYAMLRQLMTNHVHVNAWAFYPMHVPNALPDSMLIDAEECLSSLLQRRNDDHELRALLADVLTRLGLREDYPRSPEYFEKARRLWEEIPPDWPRQPKHLASRASTYSQLGDAYLRQGRLELALPAYETSYRLWKELAEGYPNPVHQDGVFQAACSICAVLIVSGHSEEQSLQRFEDLRGRPELLGGGQDIAVFLDFLRLGYACRQVDRHYQAEELAAGLAEARKAARVLEGYFRQESLGNGIRLRLVRYAGDVGKRLRDGGAVEEALPLLEHVNGWLQELTREAPEAHAHFAKLSESWEQVAKARWLLDRVEDTLDAYRRALEAQRQACTLAPAVTEYRRDLGLRYLKLGRKLCELGRLDDAEGCFRERQALWPGNRAKHEEALRELRKWAAQVEEEYEDLAPEKQQYYQRYLDLCDRLERRGIGTPAANP
jgi:tetratricopeptide (TPR) repeat protein